MNAAPSKHPLVDNHEGLLHRLSRACAGAKYGDLQRTMIDCLKGSSTVDDAILAGEILGVVGDPRVKVFDPPMVFVGEGTALIGTDWSNRDTLLREYEDLGLEARWLDKQCPRHSVPIGAYKIGLYPVTNGEYREFLEAEHGDPPSSWVTGVCPIGQSNHPACALSIEQARSYCSWLSHRTGRTFRLPTEHEWEYAAAGPEGRTYPWGNQWEIGRANTYEEGIAGTVPVGVFLAGVSAMGCYDMAGNVEEWVEGQYSVYPGGRLIDDWFYQNDPHYSITRGGSFNRRRDLGCCQRRHGGWQGGAIGFRLAETVAHE
jgi:toxoflavin biosynthesis protein ToxD